MLRNSTTQRDVTFCVPISPIFAPWASVRRSDDADPAFLRPRPPIRLFRLSIVPASPAATDPAAAPVQVLLQPCTEMADRVSISSQHIQEGTTNDQSQSRPDPRRSHADRRPTRLRQDDDPPNAGRGCRIVRHRVLTLDEFSTTARIDHRIITELEQLEASQAQPGVRIIAVDDLHNVWGGGFDAVAETMRPGASSRIHVVATAETGSDVADFIDFSRVIVLDQP